MLNFINVHTAKQLSARFDLNCPMNGVQITSIATDLLGFKTFSCTTSTDFMVGST